MFFSAAAHLTRHLIESGDGLLFCAIRVHLHACFSTTVCTEASEFRGGTCKVATWAAGIIFESTSRYRCFAAFSSLSLAVAGIVEFRGFGRHACCLRRVLCRFSSHLLAAGFYPFYACVPSLSNPVNIPSRMFHLLAPTAAETRPGGQKARALMNRDRTQAHATRNMKTLCTVSSYGLKGPKSKCQGKRRQVNDALCAYI